MTYNEFTKLWNPLSHLYNIVRISDRTELLRGASKESAEEIIKQVGGRNVEIYIY